MTPAQTKLYWKSWSAAKKAGQLADADRARLTLEALGYEASSKSLTNAEFDKVLAAFRAISAPYSLKPQLRAQEQPNTRRLHKIQHLLKCFALFVQDPCSYCDVILQERFRVSYLSDLAQLDTNSRIVGDDVRSRFLDLEPSELEKLIWTLSDSLSRLRRKGILSPHGLARYNAVDRALCARAGLVHLPLTTDHSSLELSEHFMCKLATVPCFRANCAACRDERKNTVGARSTRDPLVQPSSINVAREMAHTTEEEPF
jgi:hypothetical protein